MKKIVVFVLIFSVILVGCMDTKKHSKGVYFLLDPSGTYTPELNKAQSMLNFLLLKLQPLDTLAVARIDTRKFAEKDIISKVTFNQRPTLANNQKRAFQKKIAHFISSFKNSRYTDISGGMLQAIEYLNKTDPGKKYILIFSDLKESLKKEPEVDQSFQLAGFHVIALNVIKLNPQHPDTEKYLTRIQKWRTKVEMGNGSWRMANDQIQFENIFAE